MNIYVDIDNTISETIDIPDKYVNSKPIFSMIEYVNQLYHDGKHITYWTARGNASGVDYRELTLQQLASWGCLYHELIMGKPSYDLLIDDKTVHPNQIRLSKKQSPTLVQKGWGHEIVFVNCDEYCGKILHFNKGARFSTHYHIKKKETWYVSSGLFQFVFIDTRNAEQKQVMLSKGDTVTNEIGEPHQLVCLEEGDIFEVSTHHCDEDSYRIQKGDSQC